MRADHILHIMTAIGRLYVFGLIFKKLLNFSKIFEKKRFETETG